MGSLYLYMVPALLLVACIPKGTTPARQSASESVGDRDQDGVIDPDDKCPAQPEDLDRFEDGDGCPDLDNDGDGIADVNDACPEQPETVNQYKDDDGCPDHPAPVGFKCVSATAPIVFERNRFDRPNLDRMTEWLQTLKRSREAEVVLVGHADARERSVRTLAKKRAQHVRDYFLANGIGADQLHVFSAGARVPDTTDPQAGNRGDNARVSLRLVKWADGVPVCKPASPDELRKDQRFTQL